VAVSLRLVACGASNLSRGLARLISHADRNAGGRCEAFVAAGHGRSYGATSRVWMRRLPSILGCGLWRALDRHPAAERSVAVVTDIGNDLLYGFSVDQTASWVAAVLERLSERGFTTSVTRLPLASIATVGSLRYRALKTLFVPGCTLALEELIERAVALDEHVASLAAGHGAAVIEQPASWYGLDAIHVRRRQLDQLWQRVSRGWGNESGRQATPWSTWARIGSAGAEVRMLAGSLRLTPQPAVHLGRDGFVALY
jgi:hypothetical protein